MNDEVWKVIDNFPNYEISSFGRVRSKLKRPWNNKNNCCSIKILKPCIYGEYLGVTISNTSESKKRYIHHLVLEGFVGKKTNNKQACHNDGNRLNNRVENLRWDTRVNNEKDKIKHGTSPIGIKNPMAKLTPDKVKQIRNEFKSDGINANYKELQKKFSISRMTIYRIVSKKLWSNI